MTTSHEIAQRTAKLFRQRDVINDRLRAIDAAIADETSAYAKATGVFGFTTWMMRQACEARGLIGGRNAA